jgi:hypothetical protein
MSYEGETLRPAKGAKHLEHDQAVAAATWTITHNLNLYPGVTVVDTSGNVCYGKVIYDSANQITIQFSAAFSGKARLIV